MKRKLSVVLALLPLTLVLAASNAPAPAPQPLAPTDAQAAAARIVYACCPDSRYAYRPLALDDSLSADIFKRYLDSLDGDKLFFTAGDIARFAPYRTGLDDAIKNQQLEPAYDVFKTYLQRVDQRVAFARGLLKQPVRLQQGRELGLGPREGRLGRRPGCARRDLAQVRQERRAAPQARRPQAGRDPGPRSTSVTPTSHARAPAARRRRVRELHERLRGVDRPAYLVHEPAQCRELQHADAPVARGHRRGAAAPGRVRGHPHPGAGRPGDDVGQDQVGDRVVAVGQGDSGPMTDVVGWRIDDVVDLIRGDKGTKVRLDVLPADAGVDGAHNTVTIVRDKVKLEEQAASKSIINAGDKRIGVINLPGFYLDFEAARRGDKDVRSATTDVAKLLTELKAAKVDGVVVDLRENGGGSLVEAVELTGLFIDKGPVVQVRESGGRVSVEDDDQRGVAWSGPLAVLVNRSSASASEIFGRRHPGLRPWPDHRRADLRQGHGAEPDRPRPLADQGRPEVRPGQAHRRAVLPASTATPPSTPAWCRTSSSR